MFGFAFETTHPYFVHEKKNYLKYS